MKSLPLLAFALSPLAMAGTLFQQEAGEYRIDISPYLGPGGANHDIAFTGPDGTKHFLMRMDVIDYAVLGSAGVAAIAGSETADEFIFVLRYADTPVLPWHFLGATENLPVYTCFDRFRFACLDRDYTWVPVPYIQGGRLLAEMRSLLWEPGDLSTARLVQYTHDYGITMGEAAIPEPPTFGLSGMVIVAIGIRRFRAASCGTGAPALRVDGVGGPD